MKRFALTLAALALTGAMAFADDMAPVAKVSGYVNSGIKVTKTDTADPVYTSYANDYGAAGTWGKVSVSVDAANYGAKATAQASDAAAASIADAFVWYSPMAGLVVDAGTTYNKVSFDGVDDNSPDYFWANGFGATYSMSGISVGARVAPATGTANVGFGAAYELPKVATVHFSGNMNGQNFANFTVTGSVSAIEKLSLSAGYDSEGIDKTVANQADVSVSYAITDAFSAGVIAYDKLTASYFTVEPNVSYVVAPGVTASAYYKLYTDKQTAADKSVGSDNEIQAKVALAAGSGTLAAWVQYNTAPKTTVLEADYVISF
jgi:hypothetical protein